MKYALILLASVSVLLASCSSMEAQAAPASPPAQANAKSPAAVAAPQAQPASAPAVPPKAVAYLSDPAASAAEGLTVVQLENGMRVIVKETHSLPIVDVRFYVMTGGMYEGKWLGGGLSHLCEHLTAEGAEHANGPTPNKAPQLSRSDRIGRIGGQSNAYTTGDVTAYYISAASGKTMDCIDLVAEWATKPSITEADFNREHGIVQRELEMGKDNPDRQFWYAQMANLYPNHPAGVPVIGYAAPLAALTYQDIQAYHSQMYVPENMVFVVTGDVKTADVLERIRKDVTNFKAGRVPSHTLPEVQPLVGIRRMILPHREVKETMGSLAFQTIPLMHDDLYALDLLSAVLGEGQSSRLVQRVYRQQNLVTSVSTGSMTPDWGRGYFLVSFRTQPAQADQAEQAILTQLREIAEKGVNEQELARAKRQKVAEFVYAQQSITSQAGTLASDLMSTGDINFSRKYVQQIQTVTPQQVQAAAKKYFRFNDMVITRMVPAGKAAVATTAKQAAAQSAQTFTLPNGLRVVLRPLPSATGKEGLVSMVLVTKGGLMLENQKDNGLGNLMAMLSTKGAGKRSAEEIAAFFDQAGGSIAGSCGNNSVYWQATVLSDSFSPALEILADVVQRPTLSDSELKIIRPAVLAGIDRIDAEWSSQLQKYFRQEFFTDSPYRMLPSGSPEVVKAATGPQLKAYHDAHIKAGASVLAVYGSFDPAAARQTIEGLFNELPKGDVSFPALPARTVKGPTELHVLPTKNEVAAILVAAPGMTIFDRQDKFPIDVLDTIISGWQLPAGWLHNELRGKQLVYVVHAYNWPGVVPGAFVTYAACQPANAPEVVSIIEKNLDRAATYTPTQEEIDEAVNTILTAELLDDQSVSGQAMQGALDELWGFGYDFRTKMETVYRSIKPEDVARVAKKYLGKGYAVMVTTPQPEDLKK